MRRPLPCPKMYGPKFALPCLCTKVLESFHAPSPTTYVPSHPYYVRSFPSLLFTSYTYMLNRLKGPSMHTLRKG